MGASSGLGGLLVAWFGEVAFDVGARLSGIGDGQADPDGLAIMVVVGLGGIAAYLFAVSLRGVVEAARPAVEAARLAEVQRRYDAHLGMLRDEPGAPLWLVFPALVLCLALLVFTASEPLAFLVHLALGLSLLIVLIVSTFATVFFPLKLVLNQVTGPMFVRVDTDEGLIDLTPARPRREALLVDSYLTAPHVIALGLIAVSVPNGS